MQEDLIKRLFAAFLVAGLNSTVSFFSISTYASYYTPGNPVRPHRIDVDIVGSIGFYIGLFQILYIGPMLFYLGRSRKRNLVGGVVLGAVITALLNVFVFFLAFLAFK